MITRTLRILAATAALASAANAASIGVNTGPNRGTADEGPANNVLPSAAVAGVVPQANWNNRNEGNFNPGTDLVDSNGGTLVGTTASVSTQWTNGVANHGSASGDQILMNGGLDGGNTTTLSMTVNNVPYALYDVYVYFDGGNTSGLNGTYTADDGVAPQSALGTDNSNWNTTPGFVLDTGSGGNYLVFSGLTGSNLTVSSLPTVTGGVTRAPLNGIQIVEVVPEPSTSILALLGLVGFVARRRR